MLPRWNRSRIAPKTNFLLMGFCLGLSVTAALARWLLRGITTVMPSKPCFELFQADVLAITINSPDDPPVPVAFVPFDAHLATGNETDQMMFGCIAPWLSLLWGIDAAEPDDIARTSVIENSQRVAIGHRDDLPFQGRRHRLGKDGNDEKADRSQQAQMADSVLRRTVLLGIWF